MSTEQVADATTDEQLRAGVVGVGSMGENHARVYAELPRVDLVGITDHDDDVADRVAAAYDTEAVSLETILERCDVVTVAVPTHAHYETVSTCLEAGVHVLVEKPIAETVQQGRELAEQAHDAGLVLQVGHIERFNPAVQTVAELIDDLDVISVAAERLGPPVDRVAPGNVIYDLMVHDVDVVGAILDKRPHSVAAMGTDDGQYATATIEYDDVVATVTASRVTQKKVRRLTVTARECLVEVRLPRAVGADPPRFLSRIPRGRRPVPISPRERRRTPSRRHRRAAPQRTRVVRRGSQSLLRPRGNG
ncbi:oxidoreductase family protein [Natrinema hispanicum]|uniref:Oxidoreductase family protein n=1 Tax=Natrinema hispanicum TaxID=392421 RepID=A0A482YD87_9EURY|nr:oxidoreductase family protein [Natrinema hispanicum]